MPNKRLRHKIFKHLEISVHSDMICLNINEPGWTDTVLPIVLKPRKLAKQLRKVARWLEKK